jgi:hypothetical protein
LAQKSRLRRDGVHRAFAWRSAQAQRQTFLPLLFLSYVEFHAEISGQPHSSASIPQRFKNIPGQFAEVRSAGGAYVSVESVSADLDYVPGAAALAADSHAVDF